MSHTQSSDIAWQASRCSTRRNCICKRSQGKGDNSVCHRYSHQTLLGKSLDAVQEDILYGKSHKVREIIQFVTYAVIRHCLAVQKDILYVKSHKVREIIKFLTDIVIRHCLARF